MFHSVIICNLSLQELPDAVLREGFIKKKKNGVGFLQPPSVYLPTPIGVQKAIFLVFFACFEKTIFDEKKFFVNSEHNYNYNYA